MNRKIFSMIIFVVIFSTSMLVSNAVTVTPDIVWNIVSEPKSAGTNYNNVIWDGKSFNIQCDDGNAIKFLDDISKSKRSIIDQDMSLTNAISLSTDTAIYVCDYKGNVKEKKGSWLIDPIKSTKKFIGEASQINSLTSASSGLYSGRCLAIGGKIVADKNQSIILLSVNGKDWNQVDTQKNEKIGLANCWLYGCTYGNNMFVTVGERGGIFTSEDGYDWIRRGAENTYIKGLEKKNISLRSITWTGSNFIAVGDGETILLSKDGITWQASNYSNNKKNEDGWKLNDLRSVVWGGGQTVAVGDGSTILASFDGTNWVHVDKAIAEKNKEVALRSVTWNGDNFVIVGYGETIIKSFPIRVQVKGAPVRLENVPFIFNGRVLVPARDISNILGADIEWDGTARTVSVIKGDKQILIRIDSRKAMVGGKEVDIGEPAAIVNGRTYVPLRFIGEALGAAVDWDAKNRLVKIN